MAIEHPLSYAGLSLPAAYSRVTHLAISLENRTASVEVKTYADAKARQDDQVPLWTGTEIVQNEPERREHGKDDDGKPTVKTIPATTDFEDSFAASSGKDPAAIAYDAVKGRARFKDGKDV